jgi:hypothetical protein
LELGIRCWARCRALPIIQVPRIAALLELLDDVIRHCVPLLLAKPLAAVFAFTGMPFSTSTRVSRSSQLYISALRGWSWAYISSYFCGPRGLSRGQVARLGLQPLADLPGARLAIGWPFLRKQGMSEIARERSGNCTTCDSARRIKKSVRTGRWVASSSGSAAGESHNIFDMLRQNPTQCRISLLESHHNLHAV